MQPSNILVLVDVQTGFKEAKTVVQSCLKEIEIAKRNKDYIIVVEYKYDGYTHGALIDALAKYERRAYVQKNINNGAAQVYLALRKLPKFPNFKTINVCGVYTSHCVRETAQGLAKQFPLKQVKILFDSCVCFESPLKVEKSLIEAIKKYPNLGVIFENDNQRQTT